MADQAASLQGKKCQKVKNTDKSPGSSYEDANTRRKPKLKDGRGPKSPEFYEALIKELNEKTFDKAAIDKNHIAEELRSGSSVLVLERTPSRRSTCRALLCLRQELTGAKNIESDYRLNLLDLTGKRSGDTSYHLQPNRYYHVTCLEHVLNFTSLLESGQIKMEGGISTYSIFGRVVSRTSRLHPMIEDWFASSGRCFDIEEYDRWDKANHEWVRESSTRASDHQLGDCRKGECTCEPVPKQPERSDYFLEGRTTLFLSEVLAFVAKVHQIGPFAQSLSGRSQEVVVDGK